MLDCRMEPVVLRYTQSTRRSCVNLGGLRGWVDEDVVGWAGWQDGVGWVAGSGSWIVGVGWLGGISRWGGVHEVVGVRSGCMKWLGALGTINYIGVLIWVGWVSWVNHTVLEAEWTSWCHLCIYSANSNYYSTEDGYIRWISIFLFEDTCITNLFHLIIFSQNYM